MRYPGTWVPFALLDTAEGFIPEQRLHLLRGLLEAGLPAHYCVPLDRYAGEVSLLFVAMVAGLHDEARLLHSFGARMATASYGKVGLPSDETLQDAILKKRWQRRSHPPGTRAGLRSAQVV